MTAVPFGDLKAHVAALRAEIDAAVARVLDSGWFILGPEGEAFERELAAALGRAATRWRWPTGRRRSSSPSRPSASAAGDEVVTSPAVRRVHRARRPARGGAAGVRRRRSRDPERHARGGGARASRRTRRALLPVHLYGHPGGPRSPPRAGAARAGSRSSRTPARPSGRATRDGRWARSAASAPSPSIRPRTSAPSATAGPCSSNDPEVAARLRRLRNGGQSDRYRHEVAGINSRLDEMQAAILRVKLGHLAAWTDAAARARRASTTRASRDVGPGPARRAAVRARRLPPLRGPPPAARRPGRRAEGARDRHPHPLPDPAAPAARLRGAREASAATSRWRSARRARSSRCRSSPR